MSDTYLNGNHLQELGWQEILSALSNACGCAPARQRVAATAPLIDRSAIAHQLSLVRECMEHLERGGSFPTVGLESVSLFIDHCRRGGVLDVDRLRTVAVTVDILAELRRRLEHHEEVLPQVSAFADDLCDLKQLASELNATFDPSGMISDNASPELRAARRSCASLHQKTKRRLEQFIHSHDVEHLLQDDYYTLRDDRYVLPVAASFQGELEGIVHGTSQTGQTVYLEPNVFIEANNAITLAEARILTEQRRVLAERSAWVAEEGSAIEQSFRRAVELDLLMARARLAMENEWHIPALSDSGRMHIEDAANPVLALRGVEVIRNDITLEAETAFVIVSGPNTGGKTVTLGTLGLLVAMTQAAIPIPAKPTSTVSIVEGIHAIFGDAQDLQKDLSTFSGHLVELQRALDAAKPKHLILIDEIAVGTDPELGTCLAVAVLEALSDRGARGMVTTHYPTLKTLGLRDTRFANASVGMDDASMKPNYQLSFGTYGSSNPLIIAEQLGFDSGVLRRAEALSSGDEGLSLALSRLQEHQRGLQAAIEEAEEAKAAAQAQKRVFESKLAELDRRAAKEVAAMRSEARGAADEALEVIREQVKLAQSSNDPRRLSAARTAVLDAVASLKGTDDNPEVDALSAPTGDGGGAPSPALLSTGQRVRINGMDHVGEVNEVRGDGRISVLVGAVRLTVDAKDLTPVNTSARALSAGERKTKPKASPRVEDLTDLTPPVQTPRNTLDLRGMRADDVDEVILGFLDRAYAQDERGVWIIHGRGTGAVRTATRGLLSASAYVTDWRPGERGEGDDGVTLAWLRQS